MPLSMYFTGLKTYLEKERNLKKPLNESKNKQWKGFFDLVTYAYKYLPFHRNLYASIGFVPSDLETPADFASVPSVRKEMLQREDILTLIKLIISSTLRVRFRKSRERSL
jgi:phenylacetate-coenzyme A ligase PaaK-like adenylate-forming protein